MRNCGKRCWQTKNLTAFVPKKNAPTGGAFFVRVRQTVLTQPGMRGFLLMKCPVFRLLSKHASTDTTLPNLIRFLAFGMIQTNLDHPHTRISEAD